MNTKRYYRGFTLMEILIAIAIIAILTAVGIVSYTSINQNARNAKRKSDLGQIQSALELYRSDYGSYPAVNTTGLSNASALESSSVFTAYMPAVPSDPKGNPYMYTATGVNDGSYYGYCVAAMMEPSTVTTETTCGSLTLPSGYNYARRNP